MSGPATRGARRRPTRATATAVAVGAALVVGAAAPGAQARRGGDDARVRVDARCGQAARTRLELRARDGAIRMDWSLERGRARERWRVVVVQEASVVWRGTRTISSSGRIEQRLSLRDLPGADEVEVRASGPRGTTCSVDVTLRG